MKKIQLLIKLHNNQLDELKKRLAEIFRMQDDLKIRLKSLKEELEIEKDLIDNHNDLGFLFHNYLQVNLEQQDQIAAQIQMNEIKIAQIQQEMYDIFIDVKKYDALLLQKQEQIRLLENKKELSMLDEFAMRKFAKKSSS
jgi:flagellar export protein FliJ